MRVLVRYQGRRPATIPVARVRALAERMLAALRLDDAELSILLCDDGVMRALNRQHRGLHRTTDVLAFSMLEGRALASTRRVIGDVAISLPTAARQARARRCLPQREVELLLAHGLLHLLGCDHATRAEERRMKARTDALLSVVAREA